MQHGYTVILDCTASSDGILIRFDALIQISEGSSPSQGIYYPVLFVQSEKICRDDRLLLAFCALALTRIQHKTPKTGVILYGGNHRKTKITLAPFSNEVENILQHIDELNHINDHPTLCLNHHCPVCEFQQLCYQKATKKDNLSLLRGLQKKDIAKLHEKGIFTVNQFSYTFRPRKHRKGMRNTTSRHN
jgi:predicted RecB family nuclease